MSFFAETPVLLLERNKLEANIAKFMARLAPCGTTLRLHAKTCKNIDIARMCMPAPDGPLAVSTLGEAEYFAANGVRDILYAVGIVPQKLPRAAAIAGSGAKLALTVDCIEALPELIAFSNSQGQKFPVFVEIDCDGHRAGIRPDSPELARIARLFLESDQQLAGVLTHAGAAYDAESPETIRHMASSECAAASQAARQLRDLGLDCGIVSVGSTPTAFHNTGQAGISEVRAGVFPFMDLVMVSLGVCAPDDIALSVGCRVVGKNASGAAIIDAGWSALSMDAGNRQVADKYRYGIVCDANGRILPDTCVYGLNQEHGVLGGKGAHELEYGQFVRVLPVHACAAAQAFSQYHVLDNNMPAAIWSRYKGW